MTLDLPFPLSAADQALWGTLVAGTVPLALAGAAGIAAAGSPGVTWTAEPASQALLGNLFGVVGSVADQVLCHLVLDGRATGGTGYTQWCWVVASISNLVLVPSRTGPLHLLSGREMIARAVPRDALRATLRAGTRVSDGPGQDPRLARRAGGNAFRSRADRRLVLVAAAPHAAAARVIADALTAAAKVTVQVVAAADPAAGASARIAAGEAVDGILTDDASVAPVNALPDFPKAYPL